MGFLSFSIGCFDESMYTGVFLISLTDCFGGICFVCFNSHVHWRYRSEQLLRSWFVAFLIERMLVGNLSRASQLIWLCV